MRRAATAERPGDDDLTDIQALLTSGFGRLRHSRFLLLRIDDASAAASWLRTLPVTSAADATSPIDVAVQIAFTAEGLEAMGVPAAVLRQFSAEFLTASDASAARSRRLGDVGDSAPENWTWGSLNRAPHVVLLLYAREDRLGAWVQRICDARFDEAFELIESLPTDRLRRDEAFGFADGVSQPLVDWSGRVRQSRHGEVRYRNRTACGEFVLGYRDEYGLFAPRPLLEATDAASNLPKAIDAPARADFGRNGSYLVLRQLSQDVSAFWSFVERHAGDDDDARERFAATLVGRDRRGRPLAEPACREIDGVATADARNRFDFATDPFGTKCPLGAHVRRANPRTADWPTGTGGVLDRLRRALGFGGRHLGDDLVASSRFHRLLRRGRGYGERVSPQQAISGHVETPQGLQFLCLCSNLARQFEFVQAAWLNAPQFAGLEHERDPLVSHREPLAGGTPTDHFTCPRRGTVAKRVTDIPTFVRVLGATYAFLPGRRAIGFIAAQGERS